MTATPETDTGDSLPAGKAEIRVRAERLVLSTSDGVLPISAADIVAALQGQKSVQGQSLVRSPASSCPGVRFRPVALPAVARLESDNGVLSISPVARLAGETYAFDIADDHVLIGHEWHPVEMESLDRLRSLSSAYPSATGAGPVSVERVYAAMGPDLLDDRLSDADVWSLGPTVTPPGSLEQTLRPFQLTGFRWLFARAESGAGSILADGMGSGKTIQTIAVLAARRALGRPASLIVVPTTLLENWKREVMRFAPHLRFHINHGASRVGSPATIRDADLDLLITSHETGARDSGMLAMLEWDLLVIDEAQRIRNPAGNIRSQLGRIKPSASILLTGTPLENYPVDLWSLTDFVEPGYLGTRAAFEEGLAASPVDLRRAVRPVLLRRPPEVVAADMPDLLAQDVHLAMYEEEAAAYDRIIDQAASGGSILATVSRLRSFVAWPTVAGPGSASLPCAKFNRTLQMLEEALSADEKVVVFSWFRRPAAEIVAAVRALGAPALAIDGDTPVDRRQATLDDFGAVSGGAVLVLNTRAAGVGLNVQAGSRVIHYTLEWNPATEDQATARVYRSGQTKTVVRHRLIYDGSIDEVMVETMERKRALFEQAIPEGEVAQGELSRLLAETIAKRPARHSEPVA